MSGRHTYTLNNLENDPLNDPLNARVQASLNGSLDELPDTFENWPAERVKEAVAGVMRSDKAAQDRLETQKNGDAFVAGHPEFIDNTANAHLLLNQVNTMFGEGLHTVDHFEQAYEYLRTKTNFLKLDKTVIAAQEKQAAKQRYEQERARSVTPTEQDLYNLPLEDLKRLDAVDNQRRMQLAGERGGNGF